MSIVVALISSRVGVVASDGRKFGPVLVDSSSDRAAQAAKVVSDEFDKTFTLVGGEIIGAFCGLMDFSGQTIAEHIDQIVGPVLPDGTQFTSVVDQIAVEMAKRLNEEPEVVLPRRKVDLLLVAGEPLVRSGVSIASVQFFPQNDGISTATEMLPAERRSPDLVYKMHGNDKAQADAKNVLRANHAKNKDVNFLRRLAEQAIRAAIPATGPHPDGPDRACGGRVFIKTTLSI